MTSEQEYIVRTPGGRNISLPPSIEASQIRRISFLTDKRLNSGYVPLERWAFTLTRHEQCDDIIISAMPRYTQRQLRRLPFVTYPPGQRYGHDTEPLFDLAKHMGELRHIHFPDTLKMIDHLIALHILEVRPEREARKHLYSPVYRPLGAWEYQPALTGTDRNQVNDTLDDWIVSARRELPKNEWPLPEVVGRALMVSDLGHNGRYTITYVP